MAMIVLSSPATLTGPEEKKTGPSRFRPLFFDSVTLEPMEEMKNPEESKERFIAQEPPRDSN